ncbi:hypothetical protein ARSEF4850_008564, partial [Beauveria asiatica]
AHKINNFVRLSLSDQRHIFTSPQMIMSVEISNKDHVNDLSFVSPRFHNSSPKQSACVC